MKKLHYILLASILLSFLGSCTSARWTVKEKESIDRSDFEIVEENYFLQQTEKVTPDNPVLSLALFSEVEYEYTQRVLMQRNIQDYRLRPGVMALGVGGAAMAFYLANIADFGKHSSSAKRWTLNGISALMLASGFLNMKPVGEPRPTGEERYKRTTGTTVEVDTVKADAKVDTSASVYMLYNDLIIFEDSNQDITNGVLNIPIGNVLNNLKLSGQNVGNTTVEVLFADSLYRYNYAIDSVLQPYAVINEQITALRNSPQENADNVLADLVEGSQLKISSINDDWYQVMYGISETYIKKSDASIIWRSEDYEVEDQVVTVPRVPFGEIDVESNIPMLRDQNPNAKALLVINQNYADTLGERNYALRDGRLIHTYLQNALGYSEENIYQLADISNSDSLNTLLSTLRSTANDSTELFVYVSGYGAIDKEQRKLQFLTVSSNTQSDSTIAVSDIFSRIGDISSQKTVVLSDIDFARESSEKSFSENEMRDIIESNVSPLLSKNSNSSVLMGSQLNNPSRLYMSGDREDKKHHIFPYFFAKALQERRTVLSDIYQYLERNVSYTSRRLFDRPQNPLLLGNTQLNLAGQ
ncbi:caspase family protein [Fodinibius sp.]|uniref:caspase family protein n=1 Tax=Fodinibius sp. TaxID=1872440 RepID=UPI002ACDC5A4|nr:caspase family protein [Fodinibius sp.]MDZ7660246.1 caspase family protein [Fodinibius sp.]